MYVSEENHFEELLAKHLNTSQGDFAMILQDIAGFGTLLLQRVFLFSWAFYKSTMHMVPVAQGTAHHLVRLGRPLPASPRQEGTGS